MSHTVIGLFRNSADAQKAVTTLREKGFDSADIDLSSAVSNVNEPGYRSDVNVAEPGINGDTIRQEEPHQDGISRFFSNLFGSDEADTYSEAARRSEAIVTVHAHNDEQARNASDILDVAGAIDAHEQASSEYGALNEYNQTKTGAQNTTENISGIETSFVPNAGVNPQLPLVENASEPFDREMNISDRKENIGDRIKDTLSNVGENIGETLHVIREDLNVGKREIETGAVKLRSRIVERPVEENVRLRSEHVTVNRTPVNRPATEADFKNFKEGEVEYAETTEVPVVSKTAQVIEEVSLGKEASERTETVKDTVRNTEVDIENIDRKEDKTI